MKVAAHVPRLALRPRDRESCRPTDVERDPVEFAASLLRLADRIARSVHNIRTEEERQQARGVVRRCRAWARQLAGRRRSAG